MPVSLTKPQLSVGCYSKMGHATPTAGSLCSSTLYIGITPSFGYLYWQLLSVNFIIADFV